MTSDKAELALYGVDGRHQQKWEQTRDERAMHAIYLALGAIRKADTAIANSIRWMRSSAEQVEARLTQDGQMNSLGEFHGHPGEADRAIACRALAWEFLGALLTAEELAAFTADRAAARAAR